MRRMRLAGRRSCACRECGFTILELVVVLFVISVVAALVLPRFDDPAGRAGTEARRVASLLRGMSDRAAMTKTAQTLAVDFRARTFYWGERGETIDVTTLTGVELQSRGLVTEGDLVVYFHPRGGTEHMSVRLGEGGAAYTVTFNPLSGRVKAERSGG